jgi:hypothetical protein
MCACDVDTAVGCLDEKSEMSSVGWGNDFSFGSLGATKGEAFGVYKALRIA